MSALQQPPASVRLAAIPPVLEIYRHYTKLLIKIIDLDVCRLKFVFYAGYYII